MRFMKLLFFVVISFSALVGSSILRAQTPEEMAATAQFLARHQNPDGGFGATAGAPSSLGASNSALRALKYSGGSVPDVLKCIAYVQSCRDAASGGFAPSPGEKPTPFSTAVGLMAVSELKLANEEQTRAAIDFFHREAKLFEDIRISVAGLEALAVKSEDFSAWANSVLENRRDDGTWGEGASRAFETGGSAATLLRMGMKPENIPAVVKALREGQKEDGGWSKDTGPSDLSSSYRVMRCLFMLGERPDLDRLLGFIAARRNSDGGYAPAPGQPSDIPSTYQALIQTRWVRQLRGEPLLVETAGFEPLFNGKDLSGWEGDTSLWSSQGGMIVGKSSGIKHNDFLATTSSYGDFVLKATFRMEGDESANSGIMLRASRVPPHEMAGYQADIGQKYWGCLYDESRRNKVLAEAAPRAIERLDKQGWNEYLIKAQGDRISLSLNGIGSVQYQEPDAAIPREGLLAVQIHAGNPLTVFFKDLYIQKLPSPVSGAEPNVLGFHLKELKAAAGTRKYTLFVPPCYDGQKALPLVVFLHGSGERGEDGISPAVVGLGPAIARDPSRAPFLALFPQARESWRADSPDVAAALAALDEVMSNYKVDLSRVILTGLSMGGRGTWDLGAKCAERFAAIVPICGPGSIESVPAIAALPVWAFNGDEDRPTTVSGMRDMIGAIRKANGEARLTEYRGVGHNSWDRAYSEPALFEWMLKQQRVQK